ncbi:FGGY-family carbohydrate kinase [Paenibacillus sp. NPDC057967]|uniref:FGGY-family carbohydrate kinase n=1 Tax=Paenibacillus sp. NPDC057967 TaxID=3346293 RepID=UPI0036DF5FAF
MSYVLGIDIGTYESKGVLVDREGKIIAQCAVPHKLEIPHRGWAEHDAEATWWHDFKQLSQTLTHMARMKYGISADEIAAVGVSSIAPAVLPIDIEGNPLRKAILYGVDTRAEREIAALNDAIGEERVFQIGGQSLSSQAAGPKIKWIKDHEPEVYEKTYKFLCGSGYLVYKLTGRCVIDRYTAVNYAPLFDIHTLEWNDETVSCTTEVDKLPDLTWSTDIVGVVAARAAEETGLAPGTRVIAGTADAMAEAISIGAIHQGDLMMMYGSSTFFILTTDRIMKTRELWPNVHIVPGANTLTGGTATAGSLTRWFVDQCLGRDKGSGETSGWSVEQAYIHMAAQAELSPPGSNGLITLPFFSGERTPLHDASAKGMMFGLSLNHTTADMYRSLLEGISFSIRHNLDVMRELGASVERIVSVGGGVKNKLWLQSVSDICQVRQAIPEVTVGAAYGNAYICGLALGWHDRLEEIDEWVNIIRYIEPGSDHRDVYERHYAIYHRLYERTKDLMKDL